MGDINVSGDKSEVHYHYPPAASVTSAAKGLAKKAAPYVIGACLPVAGAGVFAAAQYWLNRPQQPAVVQPGTNWQLGVEVKDQP